MVNLEEEDGQTTSESPSESDGNGDNFDGNGDKEDDNGDKKTDHNGDNNGIEKHGDGWIG